MKEGELCGIKVLDFLPQCENRLKEAGYLINKVRLKDSVCMFFVIL